MGSLDFPHLAQKVELTHADDEHCTCSVLNNALVEIFHSCTLIWWVQVQLSAQSASLNSCHILSQPLGR